MNQEPFGPPDALAGFRDVAPTPIDALVCRLPSAPDALTLKLATWSVVVEGSALVLAIVFLMAWKGEAAMRFVNQIMDAVDVSIRRGIG